jgi:hypothetical protein
MSHNISREKVAPTHRKKGRERMESLNKTSLNHKKISTMGRPRNTLGNGVISI